MRKFYLTITFLCILPILGIASLLNQFNSNPRPTLEQFLPQVDLDSLQQTQELFGIESEPVVIAVTTDANNKSHHHLDSIEAELMKIGGVASSVSFDRYELQTVAMDQAFNPSTNLNLIFVTLKSGSRTVKEEGELSAQIDKVTQTFLGDTDESTIVGTPQIRMTSWQVATSDIRTILPLVLAIICLISIACFRSITALLLAFLIASLVTFICLAGQTLVFGETNALIALMLPIIMSISTLDVFHLFNRTRQKTKQQRQTPAKDACKELLFPCLLTTITTAGCFSTLVFQDTSPLLATFGIWGIASTILAYALTFSLGTWLLSKHPPEEYHTGWLQQATLCLVVSSQRNPLPIIMLWCSVLLATLITINQLEVKNLFPGIFSNHVEMTGDINSLQDFTGTDLNPVDVIIQAIDDHGKNPQALGAAILVTSNYLRTLDEAQIILPIDFFSEEQLISMSNKVQDNDTRNLDFDGVLTSQWIQFDKGAARVQLHLSDTSHKRKMEIFSWLEHFDETMLSHHKIYLSGPGYFYSRAEQQGLRDLLISCVASIMLITITMALICRQPLLTLLALSGSIVPALLLAGVMILLDISWSIAMLPLPCLLIGLMADDTIHLLWPVRRAKKVRQQHFRQSAVNAAPALLATTLVLAAAMATLGLSGIRTNQQLGVLLPVGLLIAFTYNLSLIPAISSLSRKSFQRRYP